ncbi:MAG TPA: alpha/beta fold hydrolase [Nevskiaceae bacterium]|nr:alpha/beta fold hydrolase [Nevskiaceae bacterium]
MKTRVILVHGYQGSPAENWLPWLRAELEKRGIEVLVPSMPHADAPQLKEWLLHLQKIVGPPNEQTFLAGHSLGCPAILRYLESLPPGQKIGGAVLVAGFAEPITFRELDSFVIGTWDEDRIKAAANTLVIINSDNDPYVPLVMGEHIRDRFNATLIVKHGAGHFNTKAGFTELPEVLQYLQTLLA